MVGTTQSACRFHPTAEAVNRCKQCGAPTCHKCTVPGPTGKFCSENCRATHEAFIRQAQTLNSRASSTGFLKLRKALGSLLFLIVFLVAVGVVSTVFQIPVLSAITYRVREIIGF